MQAHLMRFGSSYASLPGSESTHINPDGHHAHGPGLSTLKVRMDKEKLLEFVAAIVVAQSDCELHQARLCAKRILDLNTQFTYDRWRHGGWYVGGVRYPSGAVGCVSSNYHDRKWRIACDSRRLNLNEPGDFTFGSRDLAARAEQILAIEQWTALAKAHQSAAFNNAQALQEGWDLVDVDGRLQLQRLDSPSSVHLGYLDQKFKSDADALIVVAQQANAGSTLHRQALELIGSLAK